jgi:RNA polymerase sigma-70 factor, ECF subfamily
VATPTGRFPSTDDQARLTGRDVRAALPGTAGCRPSGDEQAFAALWRDLQPAVLRYFRVTAGKVAEDLAADTWVSVIRSLGGFRGDERAFRSWVFTVARHRAIDWPAGRASADHVGPGRAAG